MKTVTCTLENAAEVINGIEFVRQKDGSVSASLDDGIAAQFDGIPGYRVADAGKTTPKSAPAEVKAEAQ